MMKYYCPRCGHLNKINKDDLGHKEGYLQFPHGVKHGLKDKLCFYWLMCQNCKRGHHILKLYIAEE